MNSSEAINIAADDIRKVYRSNSGNAEAAIGIEVAANCAGMPDEEKRAFLSALLNEFKPQTDTGSRSRLEDTVLEGIVSLLLGKEMLPGSVPSHEMLAKLSAAMDTLFSTLNRIVKTIDATLAVHEAGDQTIRSLIGSQMDGKLGGQSIEEYLGRIEKAFLASHQAFRQAAHTTFGKILDELNPDALANSTEGRFKFGPMRKAEYFDIYENRYLTLQKWFESGRFMKDFLREFENNCQPSL